MVKLSTLLLIFDFSKCVTSHSLTQVSCENSPCNVKELVDEYKFLEEKLAYIKSKLVCLGADSDSNDCDRDYDYEYDWEEENLIDDEKCATDDETQAKDINLVVNIVTEIPHCDGGLVPVQCPDGGATVPVCPCDC